MMNKDSKSDVVYSHPSPGVLTRWHVSVGANVEEGALLAEFEGQNDHSYITLTSPHEGKVNELLVQKGAICTPGMPLLRITACLHDIQFAGMCASCGKDLTVSTPQGTSKLSSVAIIHSQPRLTVTMKEAQRVDKETAARLLKQRKLSLVLDLDHTLIHAATENHFNQFAGLHKIDMQAEQLHNFSLPGSAMNYFVKMRPHLKEFLEAVAKMFELHMYTFGTRMYALKVAQIIDPSRSIFKERILSRDDCGDMDHKTLKRIFPCDDSMVVIVDDREDVWKKSKNLVRIEPFLYFVGLPEVNPHPFDKQAPHPHPPPHPHAPPHAAHAQHPHAPPHPRAAHAQPRAPAQPQHFRPSSASRRPPSGGRRPPSATPTSPHPPPSSSPLPSSPPSHTSPSPPLPPSHTEKTEENGKENEKEKARDAKNEPEKDTEKQTEKDNENEKEEKKDKTEGENENDNKKEDKRKEGQPEKENKDDNFNNTQNGHSEPKNLDEKEEEGKAKREEGEGELKKAEEVQPADKRKEENGEKEKENGGNEKEVGEKKKENGEKEKESGEKGKESGEKEKENGEKEKENGEKEKENGEKEKEKRTPHPLPHWPPPPDECLPIILDVLREVHERFYALRESDRPCDVKDIIGDVKRQVLAGCNVVFSGFYPREVDPRITPLGKLAELFGAVCQPDITKTTTHLIAKKNHTDKVKTALARRITIVTENWLHASTRRWKRVNESEYFLPPDEGQPADPNVKVDFPAEAPKPDIPRANKENAHTVGRSPIPDPKPHKENGHKKPKPKVQKPAKVAVLDIPYPQMAPKMSLLDEMKQEAEEMFGDEDELDMEEDEGERADYEDREEEDEEGEREDTYMREEGEEEEEEERTPKKKSKGMMRLMGKRKREPVRVESNDDDDDDFASFLESELVNQ